MVAGQIMKPREIVKTSNEFVRSRCKIKDVIAGRILMAFASLVEEKDVNSKDDFLEYKISASSVINNIDAGGDYYKQVREAAYTLLDQKLEKRIGKNGFKLYTLFSTIEYNDGVITGKFHHELKPFFLGLKEKFTQFNLMQYMQLPSIYSQKLYAFLKSWDDKPYVIVSVIELHEMLDTPESFRTNFKELRRWVLEKAHKDIIGKTQLNYEWEAIKQGRSVISVRFIFSQAHTFSVSKQKQNDAIKKRSTQNNIAFITANNCRKEHGPDCPGGYQKKNICKLCKEL